MPEDPNSKNKGNKEDKNKSNKVERKKSIELLDQFISNQKDQLQLQLKELELRELSEKNTYDYSLKALEAQKEDRKEERRHQRTFMQYGFWLTIIVLFLVAGFVGACIYTGNIGIVVSALKVIAYIVPSLIGGYFIGLHRGRKKAEEEESDIVEVIDS